jgi:predicted enzyme related to lactoylglutathione lyase
MAETLDKGQPSAMLPLDVIEIPAPDLEAARNFYSHLFNWKIEDDLAGDYTTFNAGPIKGVLATQRLPVRGGVLLVIAVPSVDALIAQIPVYGGTVIKQKTWSASGGYRVEFLDPNGNVLAIRSD